MLIRALVVGGIILLAGIFMVIKARRSISSLEKYELENQSSDGKVSFNSSASYRTHYANKNLYKVIFYTGFFVGLFGLIFLGYGFVL